MTDDNIFTDEADEDGSSHGDWLWLIDSYTPGGAVSDAELAQFAEVAENWLTEHEGDERSISVRPVRRGEAAGIYYEKANGDLQITGYSIETPEVIEKLINRAWQHACEAMQDKGEP